MILGSIIHGDIIHLGGIVLIIGAGAVGMLVIIVRGMILGGDRLGAGAAGMVVTMEDIILITIIILLMLLLIITDMIMVVRLMEEMDVRVVMRQVVIV